MWIFCNFLKRTNKTPPDDCSCWFLHPNQSFTHWLNFVGFFLHFYSFIIDNCNYQILLRKCLKNKIFLLFTIVFYFLRKCCSENFVSAIICRRTLKKKWMSFSKSLGNCRVPRRISKAAYWLIRLNKINVFIWNTKNSDRNGVNTQNKHQHSLRER